MWNWAGRIVLRLPRVAGLNHEVSPVPIQVGAVDHILAIGIKSVPLVVEPVLEVTDEEVPVTYVEEAAGYAFPVLEAGVDGIEQLSLSILLAEDILMGPSVPVGDGLPPGSMGYEFRKFHSLFNVLPRGQLRPHDSGWQKRANW